jgi:hypothetical protein
MPKDGSTKRPKQAKVRAAAFDSSPDKPTVVGAVVGAQLHHESHWPPNDVTKVMGTDYGYDEFSIGNFLTAIQWHLQHGNPSYAFDFDGRFGIKAVQSTVGALMVAIDANTT